LQQSGNRKLLEYLLFAKKCEPLVAAMESSWDNTTNNYVTPVRNTKNLWPLIQAGSIAYAAATTDFLKWRYAFQVLRIAEYNRNYAATLELYDKLIGTKTAKNIMYPRCLSLKAGALFHVHKLKEAAYLYTRVFDLSNEMKKNAYVSFLWATDKIKIEQLEPLCKTSHEKAVLAVMDGLYEKGGEDFEGLKLIEKAWALDPNVSGLNVLMTREINKA
jgi:glutaminase